jgi:hypothetical protein
MKPYAWVLAGAALLMMMWLFIPNMPGGKKQTDAKELSMRYCSSCHLYPEPGLLGKDIWVKDVLPEMGLRLGIGDKNVLLNRMSYKQYNNLIKLGLYPDTPRIPIKDWLKIVAYYREHAPAEPTQQQKKDPVQHGGQLFTQLTIPCDSGQVGMTTMSHFIPHRKEVWLGVKNNEIQVYGLDLKKKRSFRTPSPIVDMMEQEKLLFLGIGNMLPNEDRNGRLFSMDEKGDHAKLILDSLHRPVQFIKTDLNNDHVDDVLIAEYGFETGQVKWVNGRTGITDTLTTQAGARNIILRDVNKDGLPDLYILFAQAREQVSLFMNKGAGKFKEEVLLRFPPVFGSSYMELSDMNGDGLEDLVITNGDNADYSLSPKYFHGIRIYLNDGKGGFTEKWFYPVHGATKTIVRDFDQDGDPDMAMIAFFSDKGNGESFLYFENTGKMGFQISDMGVPEGLWMVMEADDMDGDGDTDIILGNFQFGAEQEARQSKDLRALILKNTTKDHP